MNQGAIVHKGAITNLRLLRAMVMAVLFACGFAPPANAQALEDFAQQLDLTALGQLAVHSEGRVKSLDSHARAAMHFVSGSRSIEGRSATFSYLDMMLRPDAYADIDCIFVKNKSMRLQIARAIRDGVDADMSSLSPQMRRQIESQLGDLEARLNTFMKKGLISPRLLADPRVQDLMTRLSSDLLRSAKSVEAIQSAFNVMDPDSLRHSLKFVAPPGGGVQDPWWTLNDVPAAHFPSDRMDGQLREELVDQWAAFTAGWNSLNAAIVNDASAALVRLLPQINPEIYPEQNRLSWESWYFRMRNMTWVWIIYAFAMVPLLLAVVFKWPAARWIGLFMFMAAFGLHTFAVMLRWYVADRWPNSNMFEAVTTAGWFGGCGAIVLELLVRKLPMRNLFFLGSAVASMCALMAVYFLPLDLTPNINNMMPVLDDIWLYIHTNVIIFSYCLIFIAAVTASLYLLWRSAIALGGRSGVAEFARVGGAGSLILTRPDGSSYIDEKRSTFGQVLDGTTMVMMELAFITLWAGLVMGAIWADHSWGRPWGWDPKEVFALNTFIVFLLLVHVRLKVKDKGLWTAILAVIGAGVMLFNWIIINFAISGLHSYA